MCTENRGDIEDERREFPTTSVSVAFLMAFVPLGVEVHRATDRGWRETSVEDTLNRSVDRFSLRLEMNGEACSDGEVPYTIVGISSPMYLAALI